MYKIETSMPIAFVRVTSVFHQPRGAIAGSDSVDASGAPKSFIGASSAEVPNVVARSAGVKTWGASTKTAVPMYISQGRDTPWVHATAPRSMSFPHALRKAAIWSNHINAMSDANC